MTDRELQCIMAAIVLPTVKADMDAEAAREHSDMPDLIDCIGEAARYAEDIIKAVDNPAPDDDDGGDDDDGQPVVEMVPAPRRRIA